MKEAAKTVLYARLDKSYKKAGLLEFFSEGVGEILKKRGFFDQDTRESMTFLQKAAATGKWLRGSAIFSGIAVGIGAALSSDNLGTYAMYGLGYGALVAKDTRDRRLGSLFIKHAFFSAAVSVTGVAAKLIRARAERQDPRASFTDSYGQTIFPPEAAIPRSIRFLTDVTPQQP